MTGGFSFQEGHVSVKGLEMCGFLPTASCRVQDHCCFPQLLLRCYLLTPKFLIDIRIMIRTTSSLRNVLDSKMTLPDNVGIKISDVLPGQLDKPLSEEHYR